MSEGGETLCAKMLKCDAYSLTYVVQFLHVCVCVLWLTLHFPTFLPVSWGGGLT